MKVRAKAKPTQAPPQAQAMPTLDALAQKPQYCDAMCQAGVRPRLEASSNSEPVPSAEEATWSKREIEAIQRELVRLGLYNPTYGINGKLGTNSKAGLTEAFGGDAWQGLDAATVLSQLKAAKPMAGGKKGQHQFRWGEMFKDGLLDMTLGVGFDEGGWNEGAIKAFEKILTGYGFIKDSNKAFELLRRAGRVMAPHSFGDFFVKENAISYAPPIGPVRNVNAVIRLVASADGSRGEDVADAYKQGLAKSDIAYYSGHARYGSGPDFDPDYTFNLLNAQGNIESPTITNYRDLEDAMRREGAVATPRRDAWDQFMWRVKHDRINVHASNAGNVVLNTRNPRPGSFASKLMYWNLNRASGGSAPITNTTSSLATSAASVPKRKYRLLVFSGCSTMHYVKAIRSTRGFNTRDADILGTSRPVHMGDDGPAFLKFLDGILKMQSAEEIITNMDKQQSDGVGAWHGYGLSDNPVYK